MRIAIDDFGTGFSSLGHLRRFPVDVIKVDRSFVQGVEHDAKDAAITANLSSLAHALGLVAIAEGIESHGQLASVRELGCDHAQGFLFARPMPAGDLGGCSPAARPGSRQAPRRPNASTARTVLRTSAVASTSTCARRSDRCSRATAAASSSARWDVRSACAPSFSARTASASAPAIPPAANEVNTTHARQARIPTYTAPPTAETTRNPSAAQKKASTLVYCPPRRGVEQPGSSPGS